MKNKSIIYEYRVVDDDGKFRIQFKALMDASEMTWRTIMTEFNTIDAAVRRIQENIDTDNMRSSEPKVVWP